MMQKRTMVLALVASVSLSTFNIPASLGQGGGTNRLVGRWKANVQFTGQPFALEFWLLVEESPGDGVFFIPNDRSGRGFAVGPCNLGPGSAKFSGLTWRHTPLDGGDNRTGFSMTFEFRSTRAPITIMLRGPLSGDHIEGTALSVTDDVEAGSQTGFRVSHGTLVMDRLPNDADICGFGVPYPFQ
jgi:hypothetical protein